MRTRVHATITGTVQGVFFRASAQQAARRLDLTGWVRNLPDGAVELEAQGEAQQVDKLIDWCWQGPPDASVRRVSSALVATIEGEGVFEVRR